MACDCNCSVRVWLCGVEHLVAPDLNGEINLTLDPVIHDYTSETPDDADAVHTVGGDPGVIPASFYARNSLGRITHIAICGQWVPLALITTETDPGVTSDKVTYDLSTWTFPENYSSGFGQWVVASADRMLQYTCADIPNSFCVLTAQRDDNYGGYYGSPIPNMAAATWASHPAAEGCSGAIRGDLVAPAANERDSVRLKFDIPAGFVPSGSTFKHTFKLTGTGGNIGLAAWDVVNDVYCPIDAHSKPSGGVATQHADHLQIDNANYAGVGDWTVTFDIPGGTDINDVEIVYWAINGGVGVNEDIEEMRLDVGGSVPGACFTWDDIAAVAAWMTATDPLGQVFYVSGTDVCADVPVGTGTQYGAFEGENDGPTNPVVS